MCKQKCNNEKSQCECKNAIKHCLYEENYAWNLSKCACDCGKGCEIDEYLKD